MSERLLTDTRFDSFDLPEPLIAGLEQAGFSHCTPIQRDTLPILLTGQDVVGQAQTGTGKTIAFLVAVFERLLAADAAAAKSASGDDAQKAAPDQNQRSHRGPRALILAPTRELVIQIKNDADKVGAALPLKLAVAYGGVDYEKQRDIIAEGVDVLVGTPGRLIDYFKQGVFRLDQLSCLVLDEADRMFDLGFIKDIRYLMRRMPAPDRRLSMLFSATLSFRVKELAYEHMNNPREVEITPERRTADKVTQHLFHVSKDEKMRLLLHLYQVRKPQRSLIFVNTKRVAERLTDFLNANGVEVDALSGDVPQKKRQRLLEDFTSGKLAALVATDVAARGLHIPEVSHVFNFDLPQNPEDYVHRIGRTARAGASGEAISFACEEYVYHLMDIESYIDGKIEVVQFDPAELPDAVIPPRRPPRRDAPGARRSGGGRGSSGRSSTGERRRPSGGAGSEPSNPISESKPAGEGAAGAEAPKRRRRRRRRPSEAATEAPAPAND